MFMDNNLPMQSTLPKTSAVKYLLSESNTFMKSKYDLDPQNIHDFTQIILSKDGTFENYLESLVEGMTERDAAVIKATAPNIRSRMLWEMNTTGNISPFQKLVFPLLRIYYPRLVSKELVTPYTMSVESEELRILVPYGIDASGNRYRLPADIPGMDGTPIPNGPYNLTSNVYQDNVKTLAGVPGVPGPVQKDFKITKVTDTGSTTVVVNYKPDIYGSIYLEVDYDGDGIPDDILTGNIKWDTGDFILQSSTGATASFEMSGTISYQANSQNSPEIEFKNEPVVLRATEKTLKAKWTIETEQDAKALLDIDYQAELLAVMAAQIAYKIDKDIVNELVECVDTKHSGAIETFHKTPTSNYYTVKSYYETIGIYLDRVAQRIYADTNIAAGNVWAVNPNDAPIVGGVQGYSLIGDMQGDMEFQAGAFQLGTINNKYKIVVSNIVPEGKMINVMNTGQIQTAPYIYGVYQPLYVVPRMANDGSMVAELKTRIATTCERPEGLGYIDIQP